MLNTLSCGWPRNFSFIFLNTRSTSCSTRIRAFALILFMEYDVVFPSIVVNSFTLVFKPDGSSFVAHCFDDFCLDCSFRSKVCSFNSSFFCLCEQKLFFISDIWGRGGHLDRCWLDVFPDFRTYLRRDFGLRSGEKVSCSVEWPSNVCYFEVKLQHIITCIPECWRKCLCLEKTCDRLVVCQNICWLCCFSQNVCELKKCHINCQKFLWVYGYFELRGGENFWAKRHGYLRPPLWLYFLIGIVFSHEGISSNSEAGIRH